MQSSNAKGGVYIKTAICPGSFDPITNGHLSIIRQASKIFDKVIVLILNNPEKNPMFSVKKRLCWICSSTSALANVSAKYWDKLLIDYLALTKACAIVKGVRSWNDFNYEMQMAAINKSLNPKAQTVFLPASFENMHITSSLVKHIYGLGGNIESFVPKEILMDLKKTMGEAKT